MLIDGPGPTYAEGSGIVECHIPLLPLTPKVYDIKLFVRSGEGIADLIEMRTVARFRVTDEGLDAVPLRGPMADQPPQAGLSRLRSADVAVLQGGRAHPYRRVEVLMNLFGKTVVVTGGNGSSGVRRSMAPALRPSIRPHDLPRRGMLSPPRAFTAWGRMTPRLSGTACLPREVVRQ